MYFILQEEDENNQEAVEFNVIHEFSHSSRIHAIAWSPEASVSILPKLLSFYTADSGFNVCLFDSTQNGNAITKVFSPLSESSYIILTVS